MPPLPRRLLGGLLLLFAPGWAAAAEMNTSYAYGSLHRYAPDLPGVYETRPSATPSAATVTLADQWEGVGSFSASSSSAGAKPTLRASARGEGPAQFSTNFAQATMGARGRYVVTGVGDARPAALRVGGTFDATLLGSNSYVQATTEVKGPTGDVGIFLFPSGGGAAGTATLSETPLADGRRFTGVFYDDLSLTWSDEFGGLVTDPYDIMLYVSADGPSSLEALFQVDALTFADLGGASADDLGWTVTLVGAASAPFPSPSPGSGAGGAPVPEPSAVFIWLAAAAALTVGRRRLLHTGSA